MDQMHCYLTEHCLVCSMTFGNGVECPEIFSATVHYLQGFITNSDNTEMQKSGVMN